MFYGCVQHGTFKFIYFARSRDVRTASSLPSFKEPIVGVKKYFLKKQKKIMLNRIKDERWSN